MKIVIIGAGWFGNYFAYKFKEAYDVILLEENSRVMMNAATKNQYRLHLGFHYARSDATIKQSKIGFKKFKKEFPFLSHRIKNNIYGIAKDSVVSPEQYLAMMDKHDLEYDVYPDSFSNTLNLKNIELVINVDEEVILGKNAQKFFEKENNTIIQYSEKVVSVDVDNKLITTESGRIYDYDILINATYNNTNKLYDVENAKPLKYEYCVLPIYRSTKIVHNMFALTIMDGQYCSLYPYRGNFFTLSSVPFTPLSVYKESICEEEEKELWESLRNDYYLNKKYKVMEEQLYSYIDKNTINLKYFNDFFVRKVKYLYDECDRRDTSIIFNNSLITVYPGKIDSIVDAYEDILKYIEESDLC